MAVVSFEMGVVYRDGERLFLAVASDLLLGYEGKGWYEERPTIRYQAIRNLSVSDLCEHWELASRELDEKLRSYFKPQILSHRRRARTASVPNTNWTEFRTFRYSARRAG